MKTPVLLKCAEPGLLLACSIQAVLFLNCSSPSYLCPWVLFVGRVSCKPCVAEDGLERRDPTACLPSTGITGMCLLVPSLYEAECRQALYQLDYISSLFFYCFWGGGVLGGRVLLCSPGWLQTPYLAHVLLGLMAILLPSEGGVYRWETQCQLPSLLSDLLSPED